MTDYVNKDYYTTQELVDAPWFPMRSTVTIKRHIERGSLKAVNVSSNPDIKRYRISKKSVDEFLKSRSV